MLEPLGAGPAARSGCWCSRLRGDWLRVLLPGRPNGSSRWMKADRVRLVETRWRVEIDLSARRLTLLRDGRVRRRFGAVVGAPGTPTPRGRFAIYETARQPDAQGFLGPYALHLTAHSDVLDDYGAGRGASRSTAAAARASPIRSAPRARTAASGSTTPRSGCWRGCWLPGCRSSSRADLSPVSDEAVPAGPVIIARMRWISAAVALAIAALVAPAPAAAQVPPDPNAPSEYRVTIAARWCTSYDQITRERGPQQHPGEPEGSRADTPYRADDSMSPRPRRRPSRGAGRSRAGGSRSATGIGPSPSARGVR